MLTKSSLLLTFGVAVFFVNSMTRDVLINITHFDFGILSNVNWIGIISEIFLLGFVFGTSKRIMYTHRLFVMAIFILLVTLSNNSLNNNVGHWMFFASMLPAIILMQIPLNAINFLELFKKFLITFNFIFLITFVLAILDYLNNRSVNTYLKDELYNRQWAEMISIENEAYGYRMFTVFGTPLMNAFYALLLLSLNLIHRRITGVYTGSKILIIGVSIITIVLTGSRAALFLAVTLLVISEMNGKLKLGRTFPIIISLLILFNTNLFNNTIGVRFSQGFNNENDARYMLVQMFINSDFEKIHFFSGGGYNYSRKLTSSISGSSSSLNFEYPVLMFLYDYGILSTVIYYFFFLLVPILYFLRSKQGYFLFVYCILFAFLQTCNLTAQFYDFNLQLGFVFLLISSLANQMQRKVIIL